MLQGVKRFIDKQLEYYSLPEAAKATIRSDHQGIGRQMPSIQVAIDAAYGWLERAQDANGDGGVARDYNIKRQGWATSYPETTGYIIPTFLHYGQLRQKPAATERAKRMLDWLVSIQFPEGGFQGGRVDQTPRVPVTFNTGQILIGLAFGHRFFGQEYREPMARAAQWLVDTQDVDGCWRQYPTPFAEAGEKSYETHVAWGLFEAEREAPGHRFGEYGLRNVDWALTNQAANGWFAKNCLTDPNRPLTHTIGYVLRGVLEAFELSGTQKYLTAALKTADGLLGSQLPDGRLPGRLDCNWQGAVPWACLTGNVQIAYCWLRLHQITDNRKYLDAGIAANAFVRSSLILEGRSEVVGGVRGSFPVDGDYGRFEFLNWAAKFFIDSHLLEEKITQQVGKVT